MEQQRHFTQAELKRAAERAIRELQRKAASAQLKGANIHPHALSNTQLWMTKVFMNKTPTYGVFPLKNYLGAVFGNQDPKDELQRAFADGLHAGFAELHLQMPEKPSPRSKAPVYQIG